MNGGARFPTGTYTPTAGGASGNPLVAWSFPIMPLVPAPTVVNVTDQSEIDIDNHHHHRT